MISLLLDRLPTTVSIDNTIYEINSNFKNSILFELLIADNELTDDEKIISSLNLYYPIIPNNIEEAINKMLWFYKCGITEDTDINSNYSNSPQSKNDIYNFEFDSDYIYSAFIDQYNIDLNNITYLHWFKFKALFKSLKEDNLISKIIGYRSIDLSKIKDDDERERYRKLKELYKIPNNKEKAEKEKINEIESILMNSKQ